MQALVLLGAMWEAGGELAPDTVSYNAALKACGSAGQIATALQVRLSAADHIRFTTAKAPAIHHRSRPALALAGSHPSCRRSYNLL